tara:strand:+ start:3811 stop:4314 length:504 start_codon:yes stop_codon:yes gene_type:complete
LGILLYLALKKIIIMKITLFAMALVLFISCDTEKKTEEDIDYVAKNEADIQAYVEENNLTAVRSNSGLYYVIEEEGTGTQAEANSNVTVAYKGYFLNGSVFDQSDAEGITFGLNQVIAGWTEGITYFKEGGSGILLVPAHLGYGSRDYSGIPGGSVLIFEVSLISVN